MYRIVAALLLATISPRAFSQTILPNFEKAAQFGEQVRWARLKSGVRVFVDAPANWKTSQRTLVIYATPNGSTI